MAEVSQRDLLFQLLDRRFDENELRDLGFRLQVDFDDLPGEGRIDKARELILYLERRGRIPELLDVIEGMRPDAADELAAIEVAPASVPADPVPTQAGLVDDMYRAALQYMQNKEWARAANALQRIKERSPSYRDVDLFLKEALERQQSLEQVEQLRPDYRDVPQSSPERIPLTSRGGAQIYLQKTSSPWALPVDGLVIPAGVRGGLEGGLAKAFLSYLGQGAADALRERVRAAVSEQGGGGVRPDRPLLVRLTELSSPDRPVPAAVILATAAVTAEGVSVANAAQAAREIVRLARANGLYRLAVPFLGAGAGSLPSLDVAQAMLAAVLDALPGSPVEELTFTTLDDDVLAQLPELASQIVLYLPQTLSNDLPRGPDLLDVSEAYALADMLALRELQPPLVVGVLGGWGSGKSFVMNLIQQRLAQLRSDDVRPEQTWSDDRPSPYVGHVYAIWFDAWTYAKSNLWASLMQTIFVELSRQLTLEQRLRDVGVSPLEGGAVWQALDALNPGEAEAILQDQLAPELFQKFQKQATAPDQKIADRLWTILEDLKKEERKILHELETQLSAKQTKLTKEREKLEQQVDERIAQEVGETAWDPFKEELRELLGSAYEHFEKLVQSQGATTPVQASPDPRLLDLRPTLRDLWGLVRRNPVEALAFLAFALITLLGPWLMAQWEGVRFPGLVLSAGSLALGALRSVSRWHRLIRDSYTAYQERVTQARDLLHAQRAQRIEKQLDQERKELQEKLKDNPDAWRKLMDNVPALQLQVEEAQAQVERQRRRVGLTADYVSLLDFVNARLDEAYYEKQLGLMHQVRRDLDELTEGLVVYPHDPHAQAKRELFPRGPARVVLFVDDLDRCPPQRVVEVLEATQLLVKTSLFVVVLALDVRYITRALEKAYSGILTRRGDPSGLDYIEKIVQIPYQMRPIQTSALPRYLGAQMRLAAPPPVRVTPIEPSGETPPPDDEAKDAPPPPPAPVARRLTTEVITFTQAQFELVQSYCRHINLTPRAAKRLTNVYKLLKIIWFQPNAHTQPDWDVEQAAVLLLALSGRFPDLMRDVFDALETELARGVEMLFCQFFETFQPPYQDDRHVQQEWGRLLEKVRLVTPADFPLRLSQFPLPTFDLVRSFSFVGEIGYDSDELISRLVTRLTAVVNDTHG